MDALKFERAAAWAPHEKAAPVTAQTDDGRYEIRPNGTRTCVGGWQLEYSGATPGQAYRVEIEVAYDHIADARDTLRAMAYWGELALDEIAIDTQRVLKWEHLLPRPQDNGRVIFSRRIVAPEGADRLVVRALFRWSREGRSVWSAPAIAPVAFTPRPPVEVCVVTGASDARKHPFATIQENVDFYAPLCERACEAVGPDLLVLPEVTLQHGMEGSALDTAVVAPGPETAPFQEIARRHKTRILLGLFERDGDAVFNTAALISPDGEIDGKYRKVHLATGAEIDSGIVPGDDFPVFDTEVGRIGINICMDSSCAESSRMVGLGGADWLLLPIMGDHRAWEYKAFGRPFDPARWLGIMRTRAMDNQFCVVVARNYGIASCIIDRLGEVLAWQVGHEDFIHASVPINKEYRASINDCFTDITWMQRRPHAYGAFVEADNFGSLALRDEGKG